MKRILPLLLALALLTGCAATPAASPVNQSEPESVASQPEPETPVLEAEPEPYEPRLTEAAILELASWYIQMPIPANTAEFDEWLQGDAGFWPVFALIWLDNIMARHELRTPSDLGSYYDNTEMYDTYRIPAGVLRGAFQSWYGSSYDITTFEDRWGEQDRLVYYPDNDTVVVTIDGLGFGGPVQAYNSRIVSVDNDGTVTSLVDYGTWENIPYDAEGEPEYLGTVTLVIRENADGGYTVVSIERDGAMNGSARI